MKALALVLLLLGANIASAQSLRVIPVKIQGDDNFPKAIRFFCSPEYPPERCVQDAITLQRILRRYPVANLGVWNFAMATSDEWKNLVRSLGGITASPAFSVLGNRTTVLEEALFSPLGHRRAELIRMFGTVDRDLLEKAVSHELGHVLCSELNENRAAHNGQDLYAGRVGVCQDNRQHP
jgi:hypothetical protein